MKILSKLLTAGFGVFLSLQTSAQQLPIAEGNDKWIGNIYSGSQIFNFTRYWNQVTPENAGKWGSVEGTRDVYNWSQLDAAYNLAKENGYPFRFHVLFWGNQQPNWIAALSEEEQLEEIIEWIDTVAARYPDIDYIEVVNEPIHDAPFGAENGGYGGALGGSGTTGWDWIIRAFELTRERFPDAQLMVNDYNIVSNQSNVNRYLRIIELLQERDLIDVIGVQAHAFSTRGTAESMREILDILAETGLPIMATEMDIDGVDTFGNEDDDVQLEAMQRIFPVFWEHPSVIGVTFWGWRPGLWRNDEAAYLVNLQGRERPALEWLRTYVARNPTGPFTGIREEVHVDVFPNPVSGDKLYISAAESIESVHLLDMSGRVVKQYDFRYADTQKQINITPETTKGMYMLSIHFKDGVSQSQRIVIE